MIKTVRSIAAALSAVALFAGSASAQSVDLTGAGATFPYPIYSKWFSDYAQRTGVKINYQSIGSGGGIRQLSEGTVDFGASDSPMNDQELANAKGGAVLHFPTVMGAVVITYIASVTAAAAGAKLPKNTDYRVSIVNAPGKDSYPISSFTWILAYQNQPDRVKGGKLVNFLRWAYKDGEKSASALDYAPLPAPMVAALQNRLKTIRIANASPGAAR